MSKVHKVRSRGSKADYSVVDPPEFVGVSLPSLPHFAQQDYHCCGFVAALSVARYFRPGVTDEEVLSAIRPNVSKGTSQKRMINGLGLLGIDVEYREDLVIAHLRIHCEKGIPIITTVWPDSYPMDHWTVVYGFDLHNVYLMNHYSMSLRDFKREWIECWGSDWTTGAGLVCSVSR